MHVLLWPGSEAPLKILALMGLARELGFDQLQAACADEQYSDV